MQTDPFQAQHGGDLLAFCRRFGKTIPEILDFSSNINPLGPSGQAKRLYPSLVDEISRYPDPYASEFCEFISKKYSLLPSQIVAGNGSLPLFDLTLRVLKPRCVMLIEPGFSEYRRLASSLNAEIVSFRLFEKEDFSLDLERLVQAVETYSPDLLILTHPNNPTGTALPFRELKPLVRFLKSKKVFLLLDEAFVDWIPGISLLQEGGEEGVLVVRSLTKFFSLAGIRSGFGAGSPELISSMKKLQGPWSMNRLAEKLSLASLQDSDFIERSRQWFEIEHPFLFEALQKFKALKVYPSLANFFLIQNIAPCEDLFDFLGQRGIYIRACEGFQGLGPGFFRLALRTRKDHEVLLHHLREGLHQNEFSHLCLRA